MQEPEIDDELAALEANAPGARGKTRDNVHKFIQAVQRTVTKTAPKHGPSGKRIADRTQRRAMERSAPGYKPDPRKQPHARLGRAKLTQSPAQVRSMFRAAARQQLLRIKLTMILPHCPEIKYIIDAEAPRLRNVWWLSQLTTEQVAAIPQLGPKRRKAILTYLHEHQVPTTWTA